MQDRSQRQNPIFVLVIAVLAVTLLAGQVGLQSASAFQSSSNEGPQAPDLVSTTVESQIFLPMIRGDYPVQNIFGIEATSQMTEGSNLLGHAKELGVSWTRLNDRISWRRLQPDENGPILWDQLATFEDELKALAAANITPVVIVDDHPEWAVDIRPDGEVYYCAPIKPEKYSAFAEFMRQLVERYKRYVKHWELGNEPDVDRVMVGPDWPFGCWGDISDLEFYGGRQYGEMLKTVTPVIKQADPSAQVWIGGLLLDNPNTTLPYAGKPENFLRGILDVMQGDPYPYFDVVPYHYYPSYRNMKIDHDNAILTNWTSSGGGFTGKARFIRQILAEYGVDKPLFLNETALMCPNDTLVTEPPPYCLPPGESFYEMQADFITRSFVRAHSENLMGFVWYTLNGPGWRYTGLVVDNQPNPAYLAYQAMISLLQPLKYSGPVDYGIGIEAYAFQKQGQVTEVVWTIEDESRVIEIPADRFISAYTRDGVELTPVEVNGMVQIPIGFSPVYIVMNP